MGIIDPQQNQSIVSATDILLYGSALDSDSETRKPPRVISVTYQVDSGPSQPLPHLISVSSYSTRVTYQEYIGPLAVGSHSIKVTTEFSLDTIEDSVTFLVTSSVINLNVPWQQQQQSNWCWAAVSSMISHYYTWTQCAVATGTVNEWRQAHNQQSVNCCDPSEAATPDCNVTWGLLPPLALVGNFASETGTVEALNGVYGQLNASSPVCIQVAWSGGGSHFLIIDGIDMNTQTIHLEDPAYGPGDYPYNIVATAYQGSGTWVDTFLTKAA